MALPALIGIGVRGAVMTWPKVWRAVKLLGLAATASALSMDEGELAGQLLSRQPRRRRRGITANQLNSARRVNRIVGNWHNQLMGAPKRTYKRGSKSC